MRANLPRKSACIYLAPFPLVPLSLFRVRGRGGGGGGSIRGSGGGWNLFVGNGAPANALVSTPVSFVPPWLSPHKDSATLPPATDTARSTPPPPPTSHLFLCPKCNLNGRQCTHAFVASLLNPRGQAHEGVRACNAKQGVHFSNTKRDLSFFFHQTLRLSS